MIKGQPSEAPPTTYSALAIQTELMMRLLFHLPLCQTEGFLRSILEWMGVDFAVPDHTTLSRRHAGLKVALPVQARHEPMHRVVDATGLKVYGEGEWERHASAVQCSITF